MKATFPIMTHPRFAMGLPSGAQAPPCPKEIPWEMIEPHNDQACRNHTQTLHRLRERGGLSPQEAVAVLEDREWRHMEAKKACARLTELLAKFKGEG